MKYRKTLTMCNPATLTQVVCGLSQARIRQRDSMEAGAVVLQGAVAVDGVLGAQEVLAPGSQQ